MDIGPTEQRTNSEPCLERIRREHRALAILRALERSPGYSGNDRVFGDWLDALALGGTQGCVRGTLDLLARAGALRIEEVDAVLVVRLTEHGADLALGKAAAEGVLRPGPDCPY